MYYFDWLLDILNLPYIPIDDFLGIVGYIAEVIFAITAVLLIINLILKIYKRDDFSTGWTTFLLIVVAVSGIVFLICWLIPEKVEAAWQILRPQK